MTGPTQTAPVVHRRSTLEAFDCPHRYKRLVVDGFQDESAPARRGQLFHEAAAIYIASLAEKRLDHDHELANDAMATALRRVPAAFEIALEAEDLFYRWAERFRLDVEAFLLAEERHGSEFTWAPDLIYAYEDALIVVDWKTYFAPLTEEQARKTFQAGFYLWQARKVYPGFPSYRMRFVFVRDGLEVQVELSEDEIDRFERHVMARIESIRQAADTGYWPALPGSHCRHCRVECPLADQDQALPLRVATEADATRLAGELVAVNLRQKAIAGALRGWLEDAGPITVGDLVYALEPRVSRSWDIAVALEILTEHGIEPAFKVTASNLGAFLTAKKHRHVARDLEAVATTSTTSIAKWRAAGALPDDDHNPIDDEA